MTIQDWFCGTSPVWLSDLLQLLSFIPAEFSRMRRRIAGLYEGIKSVSVTACVNIHSSLSNSTRGTLGIKGSVNRTDMIQKYLLWTQTIDFFFIIIPQQG